MPRYSYKRDPLTPEEIGTMVSGADTPTFRALIIVLWLYGMRIGEALALQKKDFTFHKRSMTLHIALEKKREDGSPLIAAHNVKLSDNAPYYAILSEYILAAPEGRLFPMSRTTAWRHVKKLLNECSPHFFRHSRASRLAAETDNILELVDWFGWADPRPAMRYIQMSGRFASRLSEKVR